MAKIIHRVAPLASKKQLELAQSRAHQLLLHENPAVLIGNFKPMVEYFLTRKRQILKLAHQHPTPFYILDQLELTKALMSFKAAFLKYLPESEHYYAVKVNHYPEIIKQVVANGYGLDVSSSQELRLGLSLGADKLVFSGPAKKEADLSLAVNHYKKVTVNLDSFSELARLAKIASHKKKVVRAGVRIFTKYHGLWNKFGINLKDLKKFWHQAEQYPSVNLKGIQFHISWNETSLPYQQVIKELAVYLKANFKPADLEKIKFIDIGGGFRTYQTEGYYPWRIRQGRLIKETSEFYHQKPKFSQRYFITPAVKIDEYAKGIGQAVDKHLRPLVSCAYYTEPGRYLVNNAMHILTQVIDVKGRNYGVADGGINAIGWERFYYEYCPLINLTHPALREIIFTLYGSLCMTDDLWGYYVYAQEMKEGDLILVPYQGALTYSLAQDFIKPIPPVYLLKT